MSLPATHGTNPNKISEFYEKLSSNVQALESMGKLQQVSGYVRITLDKLEEIRGDLVRTDDDWQDWEFPQFLETLRKWTVRNPPKHEEKFSHVKPPPWKPLKERSYQVNQQELKRRPSVYCGSPDHQSVNCDKVTTLSEQRKQLALKQLCFNCTGTSHKVAKCRIVTKCKFCHHRHHSSICDQKTPQQVEHMLVATGRCSVNYPVVVVDVGGIQCRALIGYGCRLLLRICSITGPIREAASAKRVQTNRNDDECNRERN